MRAMTRVAVIDLGSNSTRLLICEAADGTIERELLSESIVTRMGEGVDANGAIGDAAIERVTAVLDGYRRLLADHEVEQAVALLTSAARDAANGSEVAARAGEALGGVEALVIDGDEEARLVFRGATLGRDDGGPLAVLDIGGGSTELAIGSTGQVERHGSAQVGVVRHTERHLHHDPPWPEEIAALRADVRALLGALAGGAQVEATISVGGTPVSCATMLGHERADGAVLPAEACEELLARVVTLSQDELRALQGLHPARAPAIVAGIAIHLEALTVLGAERFEVSERDLRHGAALEFL